MEKLIEILNQFYQKKTESNLWNEETIANCFYPLAKKILCKGYFLVNDKYIIDLGAIELYYHEEDGEIKDHIMYHTNEQLPKKYKDIIGKYPNNQLPIFYKEISEHGGYPYFEIGSFNLHQSGIDVTFENEKDKYRASFLIRSYRMFEKEDLNKDILYDPCSSHLYDDIYYSGLLLPAFNSTTIEWVEYDKGVEIMNCPRKNVAKYRLNEKKKYVKDDFAYNTTNKITKEDYESAVKEVEGKNSFPKYFKYGTNNYYKQDMRKWHYRIIGIKEIA